MKKITKKLLQKLGFVAGGTIGGLLISLFIIRFGKPCTIGTTLIIIVWYLFLIGVAMSYSTGE